MVSNNNSASTASSASDTAAEQNKKPQCCSSPSEIFSIATALTVLFSSELNVVQLNTLINLLGLLTAGLSAVVTQIEICEGDFVQPPIL